VIVRVPWQPGGSAQWIGRVLVSVTDFEMHGRREQAAAVRDGFRLRRSWHRMPGAVGLWLWWMAPGLRSGSVSVWKSADDLRAFVRWPAHVEIMRRNRDTGHLRGSATWDLETFEAPSVWSAASELIRSPAPHASNA
jgi:heme-degrading monooxygenase HmoA